jgi:hypothetical protein
MRFRTIIACYAGVVFVGFCGILVLNHLDRLKNPRRAAFILNLPILPHSARNFDCSSGAITDVIITCAFEIDPQEFDRLLTGWSFRERWATGTSADYADYASVGPVFEIARWLKARPGFKHGGYIELLSNRENTLVIAKRYEE